MAIIQTDWAKGILTPPRPQTHGAVHAVRFIVPLDAAGFAALGVASIGTGDILELGPIMNFGRIIDAIIIAEGAFGGATADVGIMSGKAGSTDASRTSGAELFSAAALTGVVRASAVTAFTQPSTELERGLGVKFSAAQNAATGKRLTVTLLFAQ